MDFKDYQKLSRKTAIYPQKGKNFIYPTLGLAGEAGEVAEKIKKVLRDNNGEFTKENTELIGDEIGDVLWYMAALARDLGLDLETIASNNLKKLADRQARNVISGSGDSR